MIKKLANKTPYSKFYIQNSTAGFTLIELLVVISIIGVILALSLFGIQNARKASRDTRRKSDLEAIRSALELYKADCNAYPLTSKIPASNNPLTNGGDCGGDGTIHYIEAWPADPVPATNSYYYSSTGTGYTLCAALENPPTTINVLGCSAATACGVACNFRTNNP